MGNFKSFMQFLGYQQKTRAFRNSFRISQVMRDDAPRNVCCPGALPKQNYWEGGHLLCSSEFGDPFVGKEGWMLLVYRPFPNSDICLII